jgi:hypothetical protein
MVAYSGLYVITILGATYPTCFCVVQWAVVVLKAHSGSVHTVIGFEWVPSS